MASDTSPLLNLELGSPCNNRCQFCPQHHLRSCGSNTRWVPQKDLESRMEAGFSKGFRRLGMSGGEPTLRQDLVRLIHRARQIGFAEVGITTNGRMLSLPGLAEELVRAGLTSLTFSLLSAKPETHDRLVGVLGAHAQLVDGVERTKAAMLAHSAGCDLSSSTLLLPDNIHDLDGTLTLARRLGAGLHLVQPFIASRANLHMASHFHVPYHTIVAAIDLARTECLSSGTRIKPFNIPYCLFGELGGLEIPSHAAFVHRASENSQGEERRFGQTQFTRIPRCERCSTPCPGFRIEQMPKADMAATILAGLAAIRAQHLVLPGLDLLDETSLETVLARAGAGRAEVVPLWAARAWCDNRAFANAAHGAGISKVIHLFRSASALPEPEPDNESEIIESVAYLSERGIRSELLVALPDVLEVQPHTTGVGLEKVVVVVPAFWKGVQGDAEFRAKLEVPRAATHNTLAALARCVRVELMTLRGLRTLSPYLTTWERTLESQYPSSDWSSRWGTHSFTSQKFNFIMWSYPFYLFN